LGEFVESLSLGKSEAEKEPYCGLPFSAEHDFCGLTRLGRRKERNENNEKGKRNKTMNASLEYL
jgi:hypothetical protein